MEKLLNKITVISVLVLAVIATCAVLFANFSDKEIGFDIAFYLTYAMIFIILLTIVVFTVMQIAENKKQLMRTLVAIGICAVVVLIAFVIAPTELSEVATRVGVSSGVYKWAGTLLNTAYIAFAGVCLAIVGSFIYIKLKK